MSNIPSFEWLEDKPRRRNGCGPLFALAIVVGAGGTGAWWLGSHSPWAPEVRAQWSRSDAARQVADLQMRWVQSPVARWVDSVVSLGASGQRLARLAPADTWFYAELAPSWWTRLWMNVKPGDETEASLKEVRTWLHDQAGLDWEQDVAPWIEPELGVIGRAAGRGAAAVDQWTWWVASRDDGRAAACLRKLKERKVVEGAIAREAEHGGVRYDVLTTADGASYAIGMLEGYVVLAVPPAAFAGMVDQVQKGGPSLAIDNARYRRVESAWPRGAVGHAFVDLASTAPPARMDAPLPPAEAVGASMSAGADWLTVDLTTTYAVADATDEERTRWRNFVPTLDMRRFDRLPESTVLGFGGTATPETYRWIAAPLAYAWAPLGGNLSGAWAFTGLLAGLSSMEGPFAIGLVAASPELDTQDPVGAVLSLEATDPVAVRAELEKTARTFTSATDPAQLPGPIGEWSSVPWVRSMLPGVTDLAEERHGREDWKVVRSGGKGLAGWTASGPEVVLAGGQTALKLSQEARRPLTRAEGFGAVQKRLPRDPGFFLYADGPNLVNLLQASPILPARYANQAQRALKPLRAIGAVVGPGIDARGVHRAAVTVLITP